VQEREPRLHLPGPEIDRLGLGDQFVNLGLAPSTRPAGHVDRLVPGVVMPANPEAERPVPAPGNPRDPPRVVAAPIFSADTPITRFKLIAARGLGHVCRVAVAPVPKEFEQAVLEGIDLNAGRAGMLRETVEWEERRSGNPERSFGCPVRMTTSEAPRIPTITTPDLGGVQSLLPDPLSCFPLVLAFMRLSPLLCPPGVFLLPQLRGFQNRRVSLRAN
jgi:hypothetical protein